MVERVENSSQRYPDLALEETLDPSQVPELGLSLPQLPVKMLRP